ncbi:MAG TPA: zf-TFIIB domain-containing protein [Pyrinomonadaceae bacterium]
MFSDNYKCVRCDGEFKWEQLTQSPGGNLFCDPCWRVLNDESLRQCPVDEVNMEKKRVMDLFYIDQCPTCGGVWLDKEKLRALQQKAKEEGRQDLFVLFGSTLLPGIL